MKRLLLVMAVVFSLATNLVVPFSTAQDAAPQPTIVLCTNNFESFVANMKFWGSVMEDSQFLNKLAKLSVSLTKKEPIHLEQAAGIDDQKPFGMALFVEGQSIRQISFLPVTDADAVFAWLKPLVGDVQKSDAGVYAIASEKLTAFAKVENGWLALASSAAQLENVPDPLAAVGDLPTKYDFAARVNFASVPEQTRTILIDQLRARLEEGNANADAAAPESAFRREMTTFFGRIFDRFANEAEHVTAGANFVEESQQLQGQLIVKPVPDTALAKHVADLGDQTTRFGGPFVADDKPLLSIGMTGQLAPEMAADLKAQFEAYRTSAFALLDAAGELISDEQREAFKGVGGAIVDSLQGAMAAGRLDASLRIAGANPPNLIAAIQIVDGNKVVEQIDKLAKAAKDAPNLGFTIDEATHASVRIHSFDVPATPEMDSLTKVLGKHKLLCAVNDNTIYFALGAKGLDSLKQAIDAPEQPGVKPFRMAGKGAGLMRLMPVDKSQQLLISAATMQLQTGDVFSATGKNVNGDLVLDFTADRGFLRLSAFATPLIGGMILPNVDLNNLGGAFGF